MKIKRAKKSVRTGTLVPGFRGIHEGELVPDNHPLVKKLPNVFEDVEEYVSRRYPELYGKKRGRLFGRKEAPKTEEPPTSEPDPADEGVAETEPPPEQEEPKRPPASGPGSGAEAWRAYAAEVTGSPAESWETLSRDEIIELLDSEGAGNGSE